MEIVGYRDGDWLIETGRGDALGEKDVPVGRVFSAGKLSPEPALPIQAILARGYWDGVEQFDAETLADVRARVEPLL